MKKNYFKILGFAVAVCELTACTEELAEVRSEQQGLPIELAAEYPVVTQTRATDNGFTDGDQVGVFIVDYEDGEPGAMVLSGNRASNVMLTYNEQVGKWAAPMTLYWATDGTPADIVGYYPFVENLQSVTAQPVTIQRDQRTAATATKKGGYEQSDLLWAKATKVSPTSETVTLRYQHAMAGLNIRLERGTGFTADEWANLDKTVLIASTQLNGTIDLTTGTTALASLSQEAEPITALPYGDAWRAVVLPQTVAAGQPLVSVTVDGQTYNLTKAEATTYTAGRMHNFTITVNRRAPSGDFEFVLSDEAIVAWEVDAALHDGLTRAYTLVNVAEPGGLQQAIAQMGLDYMSVANLKVVGEINQQDLRFMGKEMALLTNINLHDARIEDGVLGGFKHKSQLTHFVFPASGMKEIADTAFYGTRLTGNLTIPEGVMRIGWGAFYKCDFYGSLSLPTTLKEIGEGAFAYDHFTGSLSLPEGLERVGRAIGGGTKNDWTDLQFFFGGEPAFYQCDFSGPVNLPPGLKELPYLGFAKATGDIIIPQGVVELKSPPMSDVYNWGVFSDGGYDGVVEIPEGVRHIGYETFARTNICGEVRLPSTLQTMGYRAFEGTRISRVILNDGLMTMEGHCFKDCQRLGGTITWPKKSTRIPEGTFDGCGMLSGIVLHKDVNVIGAEAFQRCTNLMSIVCESEEPPLIGTNAFLGVSKSDAIVEVPASAVARYRAADGWSDFKRIVAHGDFVCDPATACALNKIHSETLVVYADGAWTVKHAPTWCQLSATSGTGKTELLLTFQQLTRGAGARSDSIVFSQTTADGEYETYCKVSQQDYEYEEDGCLTLQQHTRGQGIDVVFAGDGWDAAAIADGSYLDLVKYQTECFFAIEPYRSMRDYFNVYVTFPLSQECGVNTMYTYVNNHFGTLQGRSSIGWGCSGESSTMKTETDEVLAYMTAKAPVRADRIGQTLFVLVPNTTEYEGNTQYVGTYLNCALSICPPSGRDYPRDTRGYVQHEMGGHGFGRLADEAITSCKSPDDGVKKEIEDMHANGWYENLSTTGKLHDVPWAEFVFDVQYSDYVDVFEGGYGYPRGIYRPEVNSCMNYGIPYYNTPSRLSIYRRIKEYAGESWSMEEFRAQDTFEWGPATVTRSASATYQGYAESSRHVAPRVVDAKKMGREVRAIREKLRK